MHDLENVIEILEKAKTIIEEWIPMFEQYNTPAGIDDAIDILKEQDDKIRQLELALQIMKGTGIRVDTEGL